MTALMLEFKSMTTMLALTKSSHADNSVFFPSYKTRLSAPSRTSSLTHTLNHTHTPHTHTHTHTHTQRRRVIGTNTHTLKYTHSNTHTPHTHTHTHTHTKRRREIGTKKQKKETT